MMYQMYQPFNPSIENTNPNTGLQIYIFFSQDLLGEFDDVYSIESLMTLAHFSVTLHQEAVYQNNFVLVISIGILKTCMLDF